MSVVAARGVLHRTPRAPLLVLGAVAALAAVALLASPLLRAVAAPPSAAAPATSAAGLVRELQRHTYLDGGRLEVTALLATPAYFRATGQQDVGLRYGVDRDLVVLLSEDIHFGELPAPLRPVLIVDGRAYAPTQVDVVMDATHHRASAAVYADPAVVLASAHPDAVELVLPGMSGGDVRWERPFGATGSGAPPLSLPLVLALFGGILASMWPCLFQLSAYFIPSVAGLSAGQIEAGTGRVPVLRTAVLFVSGIVVVYTLAGLAAGLAAQSLSGTTVFESARRPVTVVAGVLIVAMAARLALRARAPLVCQMPMTAPRRGEGTVGTVLLGLAFATGCMTCFGAAVVLGMFAYVVTTASPLVGAAVLFLFSLGIAVPLVVAAIAMARVLPLLARLERGAPMLSLASAAIMAVYGLLLISGTSHVLSDAVAQAAGAVR